MVIRKKYVSYLVFLCLLFLSVPVTGFCATAYEQLEEAAGHKQGNSPDPSIAVMLAKKRSLESILIENIRRNDQAILKCDERIASSTTIIYKAQKAGNTEAETLARQNVNKAQQAKKGYLAQKHKGEQELLQVREILKNLAGSLRDGTAPTDVRGIVSRSSGEVLMLRANSGPNATSLTHSQVPKIGYLAPGDEIQTRNGSRAELQILSGRGAMTMGENSKLRLEEDNGDAEVVRTLEGKFHFLVDKAEKFQADMETDLAALKDTLDASEEAYARLLSRLKAKVQKKFESKTRSSGICSLRGTEFVVNENPDGSSEVVVIEGRVDVTEPNGKKFAMVETGQAVLISSSGKLSEVQQVDIAAISRWWE